MGTAVLRGDGLARHHNAADPALGGEQRVNPTTEKKLMEPL
jgi:hypothetical protein